MKRDLPETLINQLILAGRHAREESFEGLFSEYPKIDLKVFLVTYYRDLISATAELNEKELINLIKALAMLDGGLALVGGSGSVVIELFYILRIRYPSKRYAILRKWITKHTKNDWLSNGLDREFNYGR